MPQAETTAARRYRRLAAGQGQAGARAQDVQPGRRRRTPEWRSGGDRPHAVPTPGGCPRPCAHRSRRSPLPRPCARRPGPRPSARRRPGLVDEVAEEAVRIEQPEPPGDWRHHGRPRRPRHSRRPPGRRQASVRRRWPADLARWSRRRRRCPRCRALERDALVVARRSSTWKVPSTTARMSTKAPMCQLRSDQGTRRYIHVTPCLA